MGRRRLSRRRRSRSPRPARSSARSAPFRRPRLCRPWTELVRVFEAAFEGLAAAGPALLVIDDLQWLDPPSAALVHYLIRGAVAGDVPLGVVVASRPGPDSAPAIEALERLLADADALTIHDVGPLEETDAIALLRAAAPALSPAEAGRIWRSVGGSPYWLLAIAQASGGDPSTVLRERLDRLTTDAATLLGLSVLGRLG